MTVEEFERKLKWTKIFCIAIGILMIVSFIAGILSENIVGALKALVIAIMLYLFYFLSKKENIIGPVIGIILSIMYILQLSIVGIIIGIGILTDSISMLKYIKKDNKKI